MAGPIAGSWRAANVGYDYADKWGTGINPIHSQNDNSGRNTAPGNQKSVITEDLTDPYAPDIFGYTDDDIATEMWGYGTDTGTNERPVIGSEEQDFRVTTAETWPEWEPYNGGIPGGTGIRSENKGADLTFTAKGSPQSENPAPGLQFKRTTDVNPPDISDPSQYIIQTSMVQQNKTRAGSQNSGTSNEYNAPIQSRIPGMKLPLDRGSADRHADMQPKAQDLIVRPFWNRSAGTGPVPWMRANALYQSQPLTRTPPPDPYQGPEVPTNVYTEESQNAFGYSDEDVLY